MANTRVTRVAPRVCPTRRAVLCIPPAPPVRWIGVAMTITILLGVWNNPNPMPHRAILHAIFNSDTPEVGSKSIRVIPKAYIPIPAAAVVPGLCFSTNFAASGDTTIVASGQGVISRPVVISLNPRPLKNMNGSEIIARF